MKLYQFCDKKSKSNYQTIFYFKWIVSLGAIHVWFEIIDFSSDLRFCDTIFCNKSFLKLFGKLFLYSVTRGGVGQKFMTSYMHGPYIQHILNFEKKWENFSRSLFWKALNYSVEHLCEVLLIYWEVFWKNKNWKSFDTLNVIRDNCRKIWLQ